MELRNFREFWPFYLGEHRHPVNRGLHYVGTSTAVVMLGLAVVRGPWWLPIVGMLIGYGFAWVGHFFIENNKPASFKHPLWSFIADLKMLRYKLTGRMPGELTRLFGSTHPAPDAPLRRP